jgi:hypothetical protein
LAGFFLSKPARFSCRVSSRDFRDPNKIQPSLALAHRCSVGEPNKIEAKPLLGSAFSIRACEAGSALPKLSAQISEVS